MNWSVTDEVIGALTAWRENRGGGYVGMQSVLNVLVNRALKRGTSVYAESTRWDQFSSINGPSNPEQSTWPTPVNVADWSAWQTALSLVQQATSGTLPDVTNGATLYYAVNLPLSEHKLGKTFTLPSGLVIPFPDGWNPTAVRYTGTVAGQAFFIQL
jgi:hypothetical protein